MSDLCTLADLKAWITLDATNTSDDALLTRLISATSQDVLDAINRYDLTPIASYTDLRVGNGKNTMILRHWPIVSITTVTINGVTVPQSPDGIQNGYWFDTNTDPESRFELMVIGYLFLKYRYPNISIVYTAGYAQAPAPLVQATIEWAAYRYRGRGFIGQTSKHMAQGETVQFQQIAMPENVQRVIEQYRNPTRLLSVD